MNLSARYVPFVDAFDKHRSSRLRKHIELYNKDCGNFPFGRLSMMPQQSTMIDTFETCLWNNYWGGHSAKKITMTARYIKTKY